jgi:hypothetical protein
MTPVQQHKIAHEGGDHEMVKTMVEIPDDLYRWMKR